MSNLKDPIRPAGMGGFNRNQPQNNQDDEEDIANFNEDEGEEEQDDFDRAAEYEGEYLDEEPEEPAKPPVNQPVVAPKAVANNPLPSVNQQQPPFQQKQPVSQLPAPVPTSSQPVFKPTLVDPKTSLPLGSVQNSQSQPRLQNPPQNQPSSFQTANQQSTIPNKLSESIVPSGTKGFESDEAFQKYLSSLTEYDRSRYHQLLQKNRELKEELRKIAAQTEDLVRREKEKRRAKPAVEENEEIQSKMRILKQQQFHISNLKAKIAQKRSELDETHQYAQVREKEDELKDLKRRLKELIDERETVSAIKKEQEKALASLAGNEDQEARKKQLLQELYDIKQDNKLLVEKKQELEKELKKNHSKMFDGKIYIRELQRRIEQHKKRFPGEEARGISEEDVERMKEKIRDLEIERRDKIAAHDRDMKDVESMRKELEREHERLQRILAEKDREMRMNSLKLKEFKRVQRARAQKPIKHIVDMDDLNQEHEVNKYLLKEEKELKEKLSRVGVTRAEMEGHTQLSMAKDKYNREEDSFKPKEELKTLDQISNKEKELLKQLQELQKMKTQIKE